MTLFKDGSDAVIRNSPCLGWIGKLYIGEDVTVHRQLQPNEVPNHLQVHPSGSAAPFYLISPRDGLHSVICGHCLAPKPDDAHTWAGIEAMTGWRPPASIPQPTIAATTSPAGGKPAGGAE